MTYRIKPIPPSDRVMLNIPLDESPDARLLGCTWDKHRQSWWLAQDSVEATPFVWHWMADEEPLKSVTRKAYKLLERVNRQALKYRSRRELK